MAGPGNILIKIGADAGQAVRELSTVNRSLGSTMSTSEKMSAGLRKAAVPAAAALGAIAIGAKKAIDSASALNEQISKTGVVFGPAGDDVVAWSKTLTRSFGISQEAALEATGTFGNMLVPMGFARDESAKMSKRLVELAGDLASFNNASPEDTLEALRAGLAGESEPLRKFGVFLNDARLKAEATRQGLYSGKGALDAHAKAAATMALVLKDTTDAQGDFARTADSAANQARIQAAETANLEAELGQALLPTYEALQKIALKVVGVLSEHTTATKILIGVVAGLSAAILVANAAIKVYTIATKAWTLVSKAASAATKIWAGVQWLLNAAMSANPIGLAVIAVVALTAAIVLAYKKSDTFRALVQSAMAAVARAFQAVKSAAVAAFGWIIDHWRLGLFAFGPIGAALYVVVTRFDQIKGAATRAFDAIAAGIRAVIDAVRDLIGWLGKIHVPKFPNTRLPGPLLLPPTAGAAALSPSGRAAGAGAAAGAGGVTVNVFGAVDPEGTARAIRRILDRHDRRQGRTI